jgi:serine/threonine protein kinase/Tfp pilus assembly protein PilF
MIMSVKCPECKTDNPDTQRFCGDCGTQLPISEEIPVPTKTIEEPKEELTTGSTFAGRYQIIEELGKGGMGKVYKANDTDIKEKIAIKLIKPEISIDKKTIERFQNELKFARKIRHKNVCQMYDLNREEGTYYITMEYVSGEDLKGFIRRSGQLATGTTIRITKQICEGLSEAHKLGVVHRDLKPSNIMIDREGNGRVMDFGIARSLKEKGITGAGVMIGTPEYMSPEQVEGKETDLRSDIYSLGIILYEMVTGRVPFEGDTPFSVGVKHKSEAPRDPKELNTQIPENLNSVILKCLEKDREKRYQNADDVLSELIKIEKGFPTSERVIPEKKPLTSREITVQFSLRKALLPIFGAAVIILAGLFIWQPWDKGDSPPADSEKFSIAVLPFEDQSPEEDLEQFCGSMADHIIARLLKLKKGWRIVNWPSAMQYQNTAKTPQEISQELNVANLLTGTVRIQGEDLHVWVRLIDAMDNTIIWQSPYEMKREDIFSIQGVIAGEIANALKADLSPEEQSLLTKKPTENLKAYELYTQGRWHWNKRTIQDFTKSIEYYQRAIDEDPNYALAYAGMADSYVLINSYTFRTLETYSQKAKDAAIKALELDDSLAEAYACLGLIKTFDWDWEEAEKDFKKAIDLNPSYATAHHWYCEFLSLQARLDEALEEILEARELDPFSMIINVDIGQTYSRRREYDKALDLLKRADEMYPEFWMLYLSLGDAYLHKSMYEEALAAYDKVSKGVSGIVFSAEVMGEFFKYLLNHSDALLEFKSNQESQGRDPVSVEEFRKQVEYLAGNPIALSAIVKELRQQRMEGETLSFWHGTVYGKMGREKEIAQILEDTIETSKLGFFPVNGNIAILYFLSGNNELGFLHLERAVENKEHSIRELKINPLFDGVRSDPRFQSALQKMGLD